MWTIQTGGLFKQANCYSSCSKTRSICLSVVHIIKKYHNHQHSTLLDQKYHGRMMADCIPDSHYGNKSVS